MKPDTFLLISKELLRAREKHPNNHHRLASLTEEVGEVARALLDGEGSYRITSEAVQVAAMAIRLIEEGDADFPHFQP